MAAVGIAEFGVNRHVAYWDGVVTVTSTCEIVA